MTHGTGKQPLEAVARQMVGLIKSFHDRNLAPFGLTGSQFLALSALTDARSLSMGELADRLHMSRPGLSYLVERLVEGGLVTRRVDPHDRRVVDVEATPAGAALISQLEAQRCARVAHVAARLGPETRDELEQGLAAFVAAWEAVEAEADPTARSAS